MGGTWLSCTETVRSPGSIHSRGCLPRTVIRSAGQWAAPPFVQLSLTNSCRGQGTEDLSQTSCNKTHRFSSGGGGEGGNAGLMGLAGACYFILRGLLFLQGAMDVFASEFPAEAEVPHWPVPLPRTSYLSSGLVPWCVTFAGIHASSFCL